MRLIKITVMIVLKALIVLDVLDPVRDQILIIEISIMISHVRFHLSDGVTSRMICNGHMPLEERVVSEI